MQRTGIFTLKDTGDPDLYVLFIESLKRQRDIEQETNGLHQKITLLEEYCRRREQQIQVQKFDN